MLQLPKQFEELLKRHVKDTYYASTRKKDFASYEFSEGDYRFFMKGVAKMSAYFTTERARLPKNYFNQKDLRSGYILYFLPINALKIVAILKNLPKNFFSKPRRILDLGSGPATGSIGTLLAAPKKWSGSLTLADQNRHILKEGKKIVDKMSAQKIINKPKDIALIATDLNKTSARRFESSGPYDLIILSNVLNEIGNLRRRLSLVSQLLKNSLTKEGRVLIVEPALRQPTRELMELRDQIAKRETAFIEAPCLHQEDCPMYTDSPRDWCHMYWEWQRPPFIEKLDRLVGIRKDYLKASYLVLVKQDPKHNPKHWRIVSGPLNSKGKTERLLCGEQGLPHLLRLSRLDRDRTKANQDFDLAMRGDVLVIDDDPS